MTDENDTKDPVGGNQGADAPEQAAEDNARDGAANAAAGNGSAEAETAAAGGDAPAGAGMAALAALKEAPAAEEGSGDASSPDSAAGMAALGALKQTQAEAAAPAEPRIDSLGRSYATGRRKDAAARVWVKRGSGRITINGKDVTEYFARPVLRMQLDQPFETAGRKDEFDVIATVKGGGLSGQAGAVRHGISHALIRFEPSLRPVLKAGGFLTRDSRVVERKKYGRRKARRSFQFSKR